MTQPAQNQPAQNQPNQNQPKTPGAPFSGDPRDTYVAPEEVNAGVHYVAYSVFSLDTTLPEDDDLREDWVVATVGAVEAAGVTIRGWYDLAAFRADADLMVWLLADDPEKLQDAYHRLRGGFLGQCLAPVWSVVGVHRPAEFNNAHTPGCFSGIAPRPWVTVYPFVRSYEWYYQDAAKRSHMLRVHGQAARDFPDVIGSTTASFALGDYEWLLAFEADELHRLTDAMRAQRAVEARLHVRVETPFYTGRRIELADWADLQPLA